MGIEGSLATLANPCLTNFMFSQQGGRGRKESMVELLSGRLNGNSKGG